MEMISRIHLRQSKNAVKQMMMPFSHLPAAHSKWDGDWCGGVGEKQHSFKRKWKIRIDSMYLPAKELVSKVCHCEQKKDCDNSSRHPYILSSADMLH
jgi:hypothetical protein